MKINQTPLTLHVSSSHYARACDEASEWIVRLNSGTDEYEDAFLQWLEASPENQLAYLRTERLWRSASSLQVVPEKTSFFGWAQHRGYVLASCVLVVLSVLVLLGYPQSVSKQQELLATRYGEVTQYDLLDGSEMTLNANSNVMTDITKGKRHIHLTKGEVFFNVQRSPDVPFTVTTDTLNVVVLGTQFSVDHSDGRSVVTVLEGKVGVSFEESESEYVLAQNDQVIVYQEKQDVEVRKVDAESALAWRKKQLVYKGDPLKKVLADLNRIYERKFLLSDPNLSKLSVVAVIRVDDQESTRMKLETLLGLSSKVDHNNDIILFKK